MLGVSTMIRGGLVIAACVVMAGVAGCDDGGTTQYFEIEYAWIGGEPAVGQNTLLVRVSDVSTDLRTSGLAVDVEPYMPLHGHGSPDTPEVTDLGNGDYRVAPLTFQMPGTWEITIDVEDGGVHEQVRFEIDVPDEGI